MQPGNQNSGIACNAWSAHPRETNGECAEWSQECFDDLFPWGRCGFISQQEQREIDSLLWDEKLCTNASGPGRLFVRAESKSIL